MGSNNQIFLGENCKIRKGCSFWIHGRGIKIAIGDNTSINHDCHINAQEDGLSIEIGENCMLSNNIHILTTDSHPIYDVTTGARLNEGKSIVIGNHVWISAFAHIYKGVHVGDNSIIGARSTVTHDVGNNVLVVGTPAKVVKEGVTWKHEMPTITPW